MIYFLIILIVLALLIEIIIALRVFSSLLIMIQGPFYASTSKKRIKAVCKLANLKSGDKVVDLGSGDARVLISLAKKKVGLNSQIKIIFKSFWQIDLSKYDLIIIYGINYIMKRLEKKILNEVKPKAKIISVGFKFPNLKAKKAIDEVYLYQRV